MAFSKDDLVQYLESQVALANRAGSEVSLALFESTLHEVETDNLTIERVAYHLSNAVVSLEGRLRILEINAQND